VNDISVIVCTHRLERWAWLLECLASLERQTLQPAEVIVVVDGSREIRERLTERNGSELILCAEQPSGLSFARNLGLAHASGTFVAFLDDDATAADSWLKTLRAVLQDDTVAGVGGVSLPMWEEQRPKWFPEELLWTLGCSYRGMPAVQSDVRNVYGGSACFRKDIFTQFGGFNAHLGRTAVGLAGGEETELCMRVRRRSERLRFVHEPAALIYHRVPRQRQKPTYVLARCLGEGRSKAILRAITGEGNSRPLASEAEYLLRTVPSGMVLYIYRLLRGDPWAMIRAAILAIAVVNTTAAYEVTRINVILRRGWVHLAPPTVLADSASGIRPKKSERSHR
jgi:glucosyl-dolichyl phosphate glucuronosyltransferase